MATDSIRVSATITASPERIYEAWLSDALHAAMTGGKASIEPTIGGRFTAWDGYISGETLELSEGRKIVQTWRTAEFPEGSPHSRLEVLLEPISGGTNVIFIHTDIPEGDGKKYEDGWARFYVTPMQKYFSAKTEKKPKVKAEAKKNASKKKAAPRKATAKASAKKAAAKSAAKKPAAPAKKTAAKTTAAKKTAAKTSAKKPPAAKSAGKPAAPAKKTPAAKTASKTPASKAAKKTATKKR